MIIILIYKDYFIINIFNIINFNYFYIIFLYFNFFNFFKNILYYKARKINNNIYHF